MRARFYCENAFLLGAVRVRFCLFCALCVRDFVCALCDFACAVCVRFCFVLCVSDFALRFGVRFCFVFCVCVFDL